MHQIIFDINLPQEKRIYAVRDKNTGLYAGYDGFDTDFSLGVSPCIEEKDLISQFNDKLLVFSEGDMRALLEVPKNKEWQKFGGYDNVTIVRLDVMIQTEMFSPQDMLDLIDRQQTLELIEFAYEVNLDAGC